MDSAKSVRVVRTASSEVYILWDGETRVGQLDLHFAQETIHGTLVVEEDVTRETLEQLVRQIDSEIVSSYLPSFEREDFIVTVFRGHELEPFSDGGAELEQELELDDDF